MTRSELACYWAQFGRARTRLNFLFATAKDASITSSSLNLTLTLYHCFCIVGSYAILMCGVLDFSLYYTHDNSPCGLPLQNVSLNLFFLFYNSLPCQLLALWYLFLKNRWRLLSSYIDFLKGILVTLIKWNWGMFSSFVVMEMWTTLTIFSC